MYLDSSILKTICGDVCNIGEVLQNGKKTYFFNKCEILSSIIWNTVLCLLRMVLYIIMWIRFGQATIGNQFFSPILFKADVILLNNTFEFFLPKEAQIRYISWKIHDDVYMWDYLFICGLPYSNCPLYFCSTWQNIRQNICKRGSILVTVPSVEESVCLGDEQMVCYCTT